MTLFNRDGFACPCADGPWMSRFLLNSESMNFVTQSLRMISRGSRITAYIFCECHGKFYRVLCKGPKRENPGSCCLPGDHWGGRRHVGASHHLDTMGTRSAYSLSGGLGPGLVLLSPLHSSHLRIRFDRLKIREGSKLGKEQVVVSFLTSPKWVT